MCFRTTGKYKVASKVGGPRSVASHPVASRPESKQNKETE